MGRGYTGVPTEAPRGDIHLLNQLEMSLESSFLDGTSFMQDSGKAFANISNQNLEELLQAEADEEVDTDAFLISKGPVKGSSDAMMVDESR